MSIKLGMFQISHFKIGLEISTINPPTSQWKSYWLQLQCDLMLILMFSQNSPPSTKDVQKLCLVLQVCEWQQPLVDWQTPSLTKKKDGEMIQL